jgi:hypothetical protein
MTKQHIWFILMMAIIYAVTARAELPKVTVSAAPETTVAASQAEAPAPVQDAAPIHTQKNDSERFWGKKHPRTIVPTQEINEAYDPNRKPGVDLRPVTGAVAQLEAQSPDETVRSAPPQSAPSSRSVSSGALVFVHKKAGASVYASPSSGAKRIRFAPDNTPVIRLEARDGWAMVQLPSHVTGWIREAEMSSAAPDVSREATSRDEVRPLIRHEPPIVKPLPAEHAMQAMPSTEELAMSASVGESVKAAPKMKIGEQPHTGNLSPGLAYAGEQHYFHFSYLPFGKIITIASTVAILLLAVGFIFRRKDRPDSWFES